MLEKVLRVTASWGWPCLVAKSSWGVDMDGLACPLLRPVAHDRSNEGTLFPARRCLIPSCKDGQWHFTGGIRNPSSWMLMEVLTAWVPVSWIFT
jgi:hypothetical protein